MNGEYIDVQPLFFPILPGRRARRAWTRGLASDPALVDGQDLTVTERTQRGFGPTARHGGIIGPGTITTASVAGAGGGYVLLWRWPSRSWRRSCCRKWRRIGLIGDGGLAGVLRAALTQPVARAAVLGLVVVAIGVGNAAYEAGNAITEAVLGASALLDVPRIALVLGIGRSCWATAPEWPLSSARRRLPRSLLHGRRSWQR